LHVNIQGKKVVARVAAVAAVVTASSVVACTQNEAEPDTGPIGAGGNTVVPMGGSAGQSSMSGSNPGGSGGGSGGGGSKVMGDPCMMTGECTAGLQCLMMTCSCPAYAPTYCEADAKCSSPMKDPDHCGNCDTKCTERQACSAGMCTPDLATVAEVPDCGTLRLAIGGTSIYALSTMPGTLSSIPAAGGAPMPIATGLTGATAFAVDATNAYVVAGMSIQRVALAGGAPAVVVTETAAIHDVAVDGTTLYYVTGNDVKSIATTAANGTPAAMPVALAASEGKPQGVAASGTIVLFSSADAMNVERCDTTMDCRAMPDMDVEDRGVGHFKIGQSQGGLIFGHRSVQTDGTNVFWVNNGLQGAPIMPDAGGMYPAKSIATAKDGGTITAYATKGTVAYFAEQNPGPMPTDPPVVNFEKSEFGATDPVWLARNLQPVTSIVVDATSAYLASGCNVLKSAL
jgi:hypothetical protein